ncbi:MAG: TRAP transporter substrate-binding protein [Deltaproteobacteria bacterium]|nr:TRAP transporter substrate-binding protein [Deltaproteobacteria bacterium]
MQRNQCNVWVMILLMILIVLMVGGQAVAAKTIRMVAAAPFAKTAQPMAEVLQDLADTFAKASGGVIKPQVHWGGSLYKKEAESVKAVSSGSLDCASAGPPYILEKFESLYGILNLPLLFNDIDHYLRFVSSKAWRQTAIANLEKKNIKVLPPTIFMQLAWAGKNPIKGVNDLKGVTMRVLPSPVFVKFVKLSGGKVVTVDTSELAVALQTGMFDSILMSTHVGWMKTFKYLDYMPYCCIDPRITTQSADLTISQSWWKKLPADVRKKCEAALDGWAERSQKTVKKFLAEDSMNYIKAHGKPFALDKKAADEWRTILAPLYEETFKKLGQAELLDVVNKLR